MKSANEIVEEISRRIAELQHMEHEFKKKNNVSGRLNAKTRREELQSLKNAIMGQNDVIAPELTRERAGTRSDFMTMSES